MSAPVVVLPVFKAEDGVWEAAVAPVFGSDDLEVRELLHDDEGVLATVRVQGEAKTLRVFAEGEDAGVVRFDDALPGEA
jgi:hypothetical protein